MTFAVGHQQWRDLLFLHWEVPERVLRPLIPQELSIDTFDGRAYVGVTPFMLRNARLRFLPPVPGVSDFYEVNVRTYVHYGGREPGVWFFSLDASSMAAVLGARAGWQLPYFQTHMFHQWDGGTAWYRSDRVGQGAPARLDVRYRVHESLGTAPRGSLEFFLVERYKLYTNWRPAGLLVGQVRHRPYPLQRAQALSTQCDSLLRAAGLPPAEGPPHVLFSPGVDVDVLAPRPPRQTAKQTMRPRAAWSARLPRIANAYPWRR